MTNKRSKPVILEDQYEGDADYEFDPSTVEFRDPTYIPGYYEICQANDVAKSDDLTFQIQHADTKITKRHLYENVIKCEPRPLPFVFRFLRTTAVDGIVNTQVASDLLVYTRRGYRKVNWHEDKERIFGANGWGFPPAATLMDDGSIRLDDTALYVVDGRAERAWEKWLAEQTAQLENPESPVGETALPVTSARRVETVTHGD